MSVPYLNLKSQIRLMGMPLQEDKNPISTEVMYFIDFWSICLTKKQFVCLVIFLSFESVCVRVLDLSHPLQKGS